jgi:hypothetical protein
MDDKFKHHVCIKCCVKLSKSATETLEMLREAFGEHFLSWTAVFEWHSRFKAGQVSAEYDKCSRQLTTSKKTENVEKIQELHCEDHHRTIREHTDTVGISYVVC